MTLSFTPINELTFADTLASGDYLLVWDVSAANLAKRLTLQVLANFLAAALINIEWEGILNKPDTFPPAIHTHIPADIVGLTIDSLPSGTLIGSIAHFTGETPPATRRDGSPIQIGDRFKAIRDDYFWDGARWLSNVLSSASIPQFQGSTTGHTFILNGDILPNNPLWIENCQLTVTAPDFGSAGNTQILMKIGLCRPQQLITPANSLFEKDLMVEPAIEGVNTYPINAFRGQSAFGERKLQIEFIPLGGTFGTAIGYFFLLLNYRRVYV